MVDGASSGCHRGDVAVYDRTLRRQMVLHRSRFQVGLQRLDLVRELRPVFFGAPPFDDGAWSWRCSGLAPRGPLVPGVDAPRPPPMSSRASILWQ